MRKRIPEGGPREDDEEQRSSEEVRGLRNLAYNLGGQMERVCDLVDIRTGEYKWG